MTTLRVERPTCGKPQSISRPHRTAPRVVRQVRSAGRDPIVVFLGVSFITAMIGSYVTLTSLGPWSANLQAPAWTPSGAGQRKFIYR